MRHDDLLKLFIAAVLGILLGLEREMKRKPLGLKTCLVISVTSCLLTIVSIDAVYIPTGVATVLRADPMRLAAQIVSGIGFLGAGVIMRKNNEVISGLTTAAMVWSSAGLGIAVGAGFYVDALAGLMLIIVCVELVPMVMIRLGPQVLREKEVELTLIVDDEVNLNDIASQVPVIERRVDRIKTRTLSDNTKEITILCITDRTTQLTDLFSQIESIPGVLSVEAESL